MIQKFRILPILGMKTNVPANDPSLFQMVGDEVYMTHAVDGINVKFQEPRNSCSKANGKTKFSNTATSTTMYCLGMFELNDGTNVTHWVFMGDNSSKGRIFRYDSSRDPVRISDVEGHSGATEWAFDDADLYSVIRFGTYMVFTDNGEHTPYKSDFNDTTLSKLILNGGATLYKFKYLESFARRIFGAYSDQTNGDIEIRWTNALPTWETLDFPSGNQAYITNDDPITGIKRMGSNATIVYSKDSIHRADYYPSYTTPFSLTTVVPNQGTTGHHGIVDVGGVHYFFNKNYGFCRYTGGNFLVTPDNPPISESIENRIGDINESYYPQIVGTHVPNMREIAWSVCASGANTPTEIWYYNLQNGQWRFENKSMRFIDTWRALSTTTWSNLSAMGYTTWQDIIDAGLKWTDLFSISSRLVFSNEDGHSYFMSGSTDDGGVYDGWRAEPALILGRGENNSIIEEIWFDLHKVGNYRLFCEYRGGATLGELEGSAWESLGTVDCNSPNNAVLYPGKFNRCHQIRWGSNGSSDPFSVNAIEIKYAPQGPY